LTLGNGEGQTPALSTQDAQLRSMIETTGQLDISERGEWNFNGASSEAVFFRRMREQFGGLLDEAEAPFLPMSLSGQYM
jgi:hypothetical protein